MTARSIQIATRSKILNEDDFIKYLDEVIKEVQSETFEIAAKKAIDFVVGQTCGFDTMYIGWLHSAITSQAKYDKP